MKSIDGSRLLITGAAGFIGTNLIRRLVRKKVWVHALVRQESSLWRLEEILPKITIHYCDITNGPELKRIVKAVRPDYILHLAKSAYSEQNFQEALKTNIVGTANLLEVVDTIDFRRFIYFGSSTEYGFKNEAIKESSLLHPISVHGITKAAATLLCQRLALAEKRPVTILRPFNVYGGWDISSRLLPTIILSALREKEINITGPGYRRDWIFVEDVIEAALLALKDDRAIGEIINIATGKQTTNEDILKTVEDLMGKKIKCRKGTFSPRPWDTRNWMADIGKARKLLGWTPDHDLISGIRKTIDWFRLHQDKYE